MIDFNIEKGSPYLNDDVALILQQIDILFSTTPNEVLGSEDFGTQYDTYLYKLNLSAEDLKSNILSDLYSLELFSFEPTVTVHLLQGTEKDIALINIELKRDEEKYNRVYKIS